MEEDLAKDEIVLKAKKPRSQKQIDAFETARAIRMENSKLKKEGISKVKEDIKNRIGKPIVSPMTPSLPIGKPMVSPMTPSLPSMGSKGNDEFKAPSAPSSVAPTVLSPLPEPEIVIVKKKKKPKVIYIDGSSDEEPEPIRVKKEKVNIPIVDKIQESAPLVIKPTIRFC